MDGFFVDGGIFFAIVLEARKTKRRFPICLLPDANKPPECLFRRVGTLAGMNKSVPKGFDMLSGQKHLFVLTYIPHGEGNIMEEI